MPASPAAPPRLVAGLMSGTSLDGVDAVLAQVEGTGRRLSVTSHAFVHQPYSAAPWEVRKESLNVRSAKPV